MLTEAYLKENFIDAYFIDNERQNIEVLSKSEDGKKAISTIIPWDTNNVSFEALKTVISVDQLHERTHTKKQEERKLFEEQVMRIAKKEGMVFDETKLDATAYSSIVKLLFSDKQDDHLFALKLALFEVEKIRDSENIELKKALRQSKTKVDALLNALKIIA